MSTTNDTTDDTDSIDTDHRVSAFLTDDGTVDISAVKSHFADGVSCEECDEFREKLRRAPDGYSTADLTRDHDIEWSPSTIRPHVKGKCSHEGDGPELEHDGSGWVVAEGVTDE